MVHPTFVNSNEGTFRFSRALLARSLIPAGLAPLEAHSIAEKIREDIKDKGIIEINSKKIMQLAKKELKKINPELERRYVLWRKIKYTKPLVILLGGSTGVGTSTLSVELANLLGITRVIGTDSIREIMRGVISKNITPSIYKSTYNTWEIYKKLLPKKAGVLHGYELQVEKVTYGINAMIKRAFRENESIIIEGVHILPGRFEKHRNTFEYIIDVKSKKAHKSRFFRRQSLTSLRSASRYLKYFGEIREIRKYVLSYAKKEHIPIIQNHEIQTALMDLVRQLQDDFEKRKEKKHSKAL